MVKYIQKGEALDYTPQNATPAGSVVFVGALAGVTKLDIPAGALGALAIEGVFEFPKGSGAIDAGDALYWDSTNGVATKTANAYYIGIAVAAAASADTAVRAKINVGVTAYSGS